MRYEDFQAATLPKIQGTLNLHNFLSDQLEFMVLLSSCAGIVGSQGQGNYAAGCTFQDAFARYATQLGLKTISLDLGIIESAGYVSENRDRLRFRTDQKIVPVKLSEFLALINYSIVTPAPNVDSSQIAIGLRSTRRDAKERSRTTLEDLKFSHLTFATSRIDTEKINYESTNWQEILSKATSQKEACQIICTAIIAKLSKMLAIPIEDISETRSIAHYGADSLIAIELRNWLLIDLKASLPMLDILRPTAITDLALTVACASEIVKSLTFKSSPTLDKRSQPNVISDKGFSAGDSIFHAQEPLMQEQTELIHKIITRYSEELQSWSPAALAIDSRLREEVILLTGASGSIGTLLLKVLSTSPQVSKIYALVRGPNNLEKLKKAFRIRGLDGDSLFDSVKIEVLNYEMGDASLGLEMSTYHRLTTEVTTVVHNAWVMNFVKGVEEFDADYIRGKSYQNRWFGDFLLKYHLGTINLLLFCSIGNAKTFAFTSSISACMGKNSTIIEVDESRIGDNPSISLPIGYSQSKYIGKKSYAFIHQGFSR